MGISCVLTTSSTSVAPSILSCRARFKASSMRLTCVGETTPTPCFPLMNRHSVVSRRAHMRLQAKQFELAVWFSNFARIFLSAPAMSWLLLKTRMMDSQHFNAGECACACGVGLGTLAPRANTHPGPGAPT